MDAATPLLGTAFFAATPFLAERLARTLVQRGHHELQRRETLVDVLSLPELLPLHAALTHALGAGEVDQVQLTGTLGVVTRVAQRHVHGEHKVGTRRGGIHERRMRVPSLARCGQMLCDRLPGIKGQRREVWHTHRPVGRRAHLERVGHHLPSTPVEELLMKQVQNLLIVHFEHRAREEDLERLGTARVLLLEQPRLAQQLVARQVHQARLATCALHRVRLPRARLAVSHHAHVLPLQHRGDRGRHLIVQLLRRAHTAEARVEGALDACAIAFGRRWCLQRDQIVRWHRDDGGLPLANFRR